jgi:hypothetical protein
MAWTLYEASKRNACYPNSCSGQIKLKSVDHALQKWSPVSPEVPVNIQWRLVFTIPSVNPTLSTKIQATWSWSVCTVFWGGGARVQDFLNPLWGTTLYWVQDLQSLSEIGSNRLSESSVLTSVAWQKEFHLCQHVLYLEQSIDVLYLKQSNEVIVHVILAWHAIKFVLCMVL